MKMKKVFVFLFLFIICDVSAQWSVGGRAGVNWSRMTNFPLGIGDSKQKLGFNVGAIGNYHFNSWIELQGELLYSQQGFKDEISTSFVNSSTFDVNMMSQYIDVPILVKFYPFKKKECFNIQAGIQTGFFLTESAKSDDSSIQNIYGKKNPVDFGLVFGLAYNFEKGLFFDARYVLGLTNNYKEFEGIRGQSIHLSVGYLFHL